MNHPTDPSAMREYELEPVGSAYYAVRFLTDGRYLGRHLEERGLTRVPIALANCYSTAEAAYAAAQAFVGRP